MDRELLIKMRDALINADIQLEYEGYNPNSPIRSELNSALKAYDKYAKEYGRRVG